MTHEPNSRNPPGCSPTPRSGHLTGAYPLGLRPALWEIASLRSVTSDTSTITWSTRTRRVKTF